MTAFFVYDVFFDFDFIKFEMKLGIKEWKKSDDYF